MFGAFKIDSLYFELGTFYWNGIITKFGGDVKARVVSNPLVRIEPKTEVELIIHWYCQLSMILSRLTYLHGGIKGSLLSQVNNELIIKPSSGRSSKPCNQDSSTY